jgi:uncharacterized FlgJ-related protein
MLYKFDKTNLEYKRIDKTLLIPYLGLLGILIILTILQFSTNKKVEDTHYITEETKLLILNETTKFTPEKLKQYLVELNIKFPHIVYAQTKLETGNFESKIFRENNNLFGMKVARIRPTTNKGEQYNHAVFNNWRESVVDYALYQASYLRDIKTETQYYEYLAKNYAEDTNYISKIKRIVNDEKNQ